MTHATAPGDVATNREVLAVPAFRRLTLTWFFTNLGDSALYITAAIWVKNLTGSDAAAGLVFAALGLPALLAPIVGQLADRFRRKPLLIVNNLAAAAVVLLLLTVDTVDDVWMVYVVMFLYGTASYLTAAAQSGILRTMLEDRFLAPANGLLSSIDQSLRIISPLIGAALFTVGGMDAVTLLTASSFVVAAVVLATLELTEPCPYREPGESFWQSTTAGVRFLAGHPFLRRGTLAMIIAVGATGVINITIFATIEQGLRLPLQTLNIGIAVQGVFAVLAGLTVGAVIRKLGIRGTMIAGLLMLSVAIAGQATILVPVALGAVAVTGAGVVWALVAFVTTRQQLTPPGMQGRTSAAANMLMNVPQVLTALITSTLIGLIDYRVLIIGTAVLCATSTLPLLLTPTALLTDGRPAGQQQG